VGAEHYCITHQTGTCSAAPIHDENGQLIGCLNMTGLKEAAHPHTLGIVLAGAYSIEKQLALIRSNQIIDTAFNSINEGILITDSKLNLILANKAALKILGIEQEQIFHIPIVSLIQNHESVDEIITSLKPIFDAECTFCTGSKSVRTTANFAPILDTSGISGLVITFKEEKYVHRFVNKIAGYRANYVFEDIVAVNPNMKKVIESARKASITDCNVLITGESGTGKELFAQAIHNNSKRAKGPFVAVNCASLPKDLVESELFGYEKGAFTGANKEGHPGKFELADGGTIFLDEIGELPIEIQPKLLRVLDNHKISRVGSTHERQVNVRVLAATNKNLRKEVDNKNFRDDLYYRLNVINITIPPLRNRMEDVRVLANVFLSRLNKANPENHKEFDKDFITKLERYHWPGNVRELQNVIERAYYLTDGRLITEEYLPENISIGLKNEDSKLKDNIIPLKIIEERSIKNTLAASGGDILKTAEMLNLSRATIYRKIKKYNIDVNSYKN
ncbi:MAG TPA: sigma 54-interacting transcriptional regulator, partial [Tepidanaerobacter syntrophicus]